MSTTSWVVSIIIVVAVMVGGWWFFMQPAAAPVTINTGSTSNDGSLTGTVATSSGDRTDGSSVSIDVGVSTLPKSVAVNFTSNGFVPKSVTIAKGGTVTFVNQSSGQMWVASDEHPSHTGYDGSSRTTHCTASYSGPAPFDQCGNGSQYSFTFDKTGAFDFHNHSGAQYGGVVIVQ